MAALRNAPRCRARCSAAPARRRRAAPRARGPPPGGAESDGGRSADETARKYGLEAGLWQSLTDGENTPNQKKTNAKDLLKRYGSAYLATSISLSLVSFTVFYLLVSNGVDVAALLGRVGIDVSGGGEKAGTAALAYVAHKAASPLRFPPTVALTPLVAKALGKEVDSDSDSDSDEGER